VLADLPGGHHGRQKAGGSIHFPDGNATVARLLVRWLIPDAVPGSTQEDVGPAHVDYGRLDRAGQTARIRLGSTAVNVRHDGDPGSAREVVVTYSRGGRLADVRARHVVMACWNMVIPHLVPDLPAAQKEALVYGVKGPLVYTSVALTNWRAFQKLGVANINAPTMYHDSFGLGEAVSLGDLHHPQSPDEPIVIRMDRHPVPGNRARSSTASAAPICSRPRSRLSSATSVTAGPHPGAAASTRRDRWDHRQPWPHGYAYTYNTLFDPPEWALTDSAERPCVKARQPFFRITIANADAAASPHTDAAIREAARAVRELPV
jgi:spermidine dehydrogenase